MLTPTTHTASSLLDLEAIATSLPRALQSEADSKAATIVTLTGDLGAGKTTFVQTLGRTLSVADSITSPTFVVMKSYGLPEGQPWDRLVHIDAYRFTDPAEALPLKLPGLFLEPRTLICIEWPERLGEYAPVANAAVTINSVDEEIRTFTITYGQT